MYKKISLLFVLLCVGMHTLQAQRTRDELTRILFIFDCSGSMNESWGKELKITIAKRAMLKFLDSLQSVPNLQLALRMYGHQTPSPPPDCTDSRLEVPFAYNNIPAMKQKINDVVPKGTTPIAYSLLKAADDFTTCTDCRNIIILITDGIEACDGDPCAISLALQKKGVILQPFIIGVGLDVKLIDSFKCMGRYIDASNPSDFQSALTKVVVEASGVTTAQVNLNDIYAKPTETNVNMTFYDAYSGLMKYNFIHTINGKGNPDTLEIDPLVTYKLVVHTLPPVTVDNIKLETAKHNIIKANTPQGYLKITEKLGTKLNGVDVVVYPSNDCNALNVQKINDTEKYIVGTYDVEVHTLPRLFLADIQVKQSQTNIIEVATPGIANITMPTQGFGSLYKFENNEMVWIYNLKPTLTREILDMQPGKYIAVFRPAKMLSYEYTVQRSFEVTSGKTITVDLSRYGQ